MLAVIDRALHFPVKFDANEWFVLINLVVGYTIVAILPKRFPIVVSVLAILFSMTMAILTDHSIAGPPLDLYDIGDMKEYELFDVITYPMYTPYAWIAAYVYDKWKPKGLFITAYIIAWSLLACFFEWLADLCHVFTYNNWNLVYSFGVYIVTSTLYISFFRYMLSYFYKTAGVSRVSQ